MSKGNNSHGGRGGRRKHNVHCVKPSDPPFLRAMKERCGYKEAADLNTKRQIIRSTTDDSGDEDNDDERPQVVALCEGDLTQKEADELFSKAKQEHAKSADSSAKNAESTSNSKMIFSSANKRRSEGEQISEQNSTSSKKKKKLQEDLARKNNVQPVKDNRLLSFGNDEDEDDE